MPERSQVPPENDGSHERPMKRKRVALACEACRERKVRCDGGKPVCRPCAKRAESSLPCVYSVISSSAKQVSEQEYIASLQRQVQDLNQVIDSYSSSSRGGDRDASAQISASPLASPSPIRSGLQSQFQQQSLPPGDTSQTSTLSAHDAFRDRVGPPAATSVSSVTAVRGHHNGDPDPPYSPHAGNETSPVNAMGASIAVRSPGVSSQEAEFYGQSSVHSLLQHVPRSGQWQQKAANAFGTHQDRRNSPHHRGRYPETVDSLLQSQYALPPRRMANTLVDLYFDNVHIFYPWVHSPSFRYRFEDLWGADGLQEVGRSSQGDIGLGGDKCPVRTYYCAVNAMFALGCEFSDFPDKQAASATFYGRVRDLLDAEILDHSSISHLQVLLLVSHYLLTTQYPTRCYNMIGLACRMAVGLGLHLDKSGLGRSEVEKQVRRRLWHGCFQVEMFVSMTLGRPPYFMANNDVPLPDAVDDNYLEAQGDSSGQPHNTPSQNLFTVTNIKFTKILGMILSRIYHPTQQDAPPPSRPPDFTTLLQLDGMLQEARKEIPEPLNWDALPVPEAATLLERHQLLRRQANVLQARWLHLQVLLYRPCFTSFCEAARPPPSRSEWSNQPAVADSSLFENELANSVRNKCAIVCTEYACELVETVSRATSDMATGALWFSLFYLITSGVIIILAECTQLQRQTFNGAALARAWELCSTTLQQMGATHDRAREYLQSLRILRERTFQAYGNSCDQLQPSTAHLQPVGVAEQAGTRPEQHQPDGYYDTQEDALWNINVVHGTGFFEHDWGAPFLFENLGEDWLEGSFPHQGGLQDHAVSMQESIND